MNNNKIVRGPHLREEASLSKTNDGLEVRLNSIGSNLTDNFVLTIAKDNRSEVSKRRGILTLRNQAQISKIHLSIHGIGGEGVGEKCNKQRAQRFPIFLVHGKGEDHQD